MRSANCCWVSPIMTRRCRICAPTCLSMSRVLLLRLLILRFLKFGIWSTHEISVHLPARNDRALSVYSDWIGAINRHVPPTVERFIPLRAIYVNYFIGQARCSTGRAEFAPQPIREGDHCVTPCSRQDSSARGASSIRSRG